MTKRAPREFFPGIQKIRYEGIGSDNPLSFKFYEESRVVGKKTLKEHLRFAVCYWHSLCGSGADPFGQGTWQRPWDDFERPMDRARARLDAAFELFVKLGAPFYCFHDRDLAPEGESVAESEKNLMELSALAKERQGDSGVRLLWGTANLFSHPRYMNGAATNPDFHVVAHAAAQVKSALQATVELSGEGFVFWGGREGYLTLLNTDMKRELDHLARFLAMARDYGRKIGFAGKFYVEPKPMEPSKHQYDFDAATTIGFLRAHGLEQDFALNIEANHATLANHTFAHELQVAVDAGMLGSIDANRGDSQNGWDTDQFPTNLYDIVSALLVIQGAGGFGHGGVNFDAKLRRNSTDLADLFIAHIGAMDAFARGLVIADALRHEARLPERKTARYRSFDSGPGLGFERGELTLESLGTHAEQAFAIAPHSGQQELLENLVNQYLHRA